MGEKRLKEIVALAKSFLLSLSRMVDTHDSYPSPSSLGVTFVLEALLHLHMQGHMYLGRDRYV